MKLAILMGDEYVSDSFGRLGAYYAKSAMGMIRDNVRSRPEAVADALEKMRTHMNTAASKAIHAGVTQKFTSINVKDGHIEFRSPGGDLLIHAGDFMNSGYIPIEAMEFFNWFDKINNYDTKVLIALNIDPQTASAKSLDPFLG